MDMEGSEDVRREGLWKDGRINGSEVVGLESFWNQRTGGERAVYFLVKFNSDKMEGWVSKQGEQTSSGGIDTWFHRLFLGSP